MSWLLAHAVQVFAGLTCVLVACHVAHLFTQEWIVLVSSLVTVAATLMPTGVVVSLLPEPPEPKGPQKK